jgi:ABC-type transport system involved in Fe-S cluster assembly fused permease/ATPase subunit
VVCDLELSRLSDTHSQATSALDALSELRVNEAIERILQSQETSTLIVAHRYGFCQRNLARVINFCHDSLSTIARAGRIVVLEGVCLLTRILGFLLNFLQMDE